MRLLSSLLLLAMLADAGPAEFGQSELDAAMAQRKLKWKNQVELSLDAPDTFRIEPYSMGGAHITGGDLRGLMYGLLEAAEQIRDSGHFTKTTGIPAASLRGVRIVLTPELEQASEEFWNSYFRMLARNRFNRVHVAFARIEAPYRLPQFLSHTAADYGIDFTLGIGGGVTAEELAHALIVCPSIRGVALEDASAQAAVFSALRVAGRRVTLDLDGATAEPAVLQTALAEGVPVLRPAAAWPPSFETAPPIDAANAEAHPVFYEVMGRLSYDPKSKQEYRAAREVELWIAAAQQSNLGGSDYVAAAGETVRGGSAKFTPPEIAERLDAAAAQVGDTADADLRLLAELAREQAAQLRSASTLRAPARGMPPMWNHMPPASAPSEQPLTLTLHLAQPRTVSAVRLHFRPTDPAAATQVIEQAAKAELSFIVPGREITGNWDLQYFFEFLNADGSGWFAPDPLTATPYWVVHVIAPHTGRN
ncbi:MAG TPA: hypothetical protein VLM42_02270 [Bryobacteraceae bacterium]|nr:hypothetical protein [Bryobacteraceae bacterium]